MSELRGDMQEARCGVGSVGSQMGPIITWEIDRDTEQESTEVSICGMDRGHARMKSALPRQIYLTCH